VASRACRQLVIADVIHDQDYFRREVEPWIDGDRVRHVGSVGPEERDEILGGADALRHLINFNEPFGLSMIAAMACGAPVITRLRGSVPEGIRHQGTGFIVHDLDEVVAAVNRPGETSRERGRRCIEKSLSHERMVENYIEVYKEVLRINLASEISLETPRGSVQ
jgi:glycosyltransferase involved in cell wall biosynthesis